MKTEDDAKSLNPLQTNTCICFTLLFASEIDTLGLITPQKCFLHYGEDR